MELDNDYKKKPKEYFGESRPELVPFIPKGINNLLDVGCSSGTFGANLKTKFPHLTIWGIEPHKESAERAQKQLDKVICSLFDSDVPELENQKFDCITFNDVLEHITAPASTLKKCHHLLAEKGQIIASIPNVLFFPVMYDLIKNGDWKYSDSGVLDNTHVKFYTRKSIIRLFEENGYAVLSTDGINLKIHEKFRLYKLLNFFLFNRLKDWKYMQFVVVAVKK